MTVLHIMDKSNINESYIKFINKNFDVNKHIFIYDGGSSNKHIKISDEPNVIVNDRIKNRYLKIIETFIILNKYFYKSEKIILHGLFNPRVLLFLLFHPWLLKKCNWVIWGGDLYSYQKPKVTIKQKLYEFMRAFCIKRFGGIVSLTEGDYQLVKEWYNTNAKEYFGMYINPVKKEYLDNIKIKEKKEIYIQIGNSADSSNNHIEIIDLLIKYKNENMKIFAPLSYGNKDYAFEVKKYGEEIFGDKFIAMMEFLKPEEYSEYLGSIDISIFNHKRQQGLFNIESLLYLQKKVYIRKDISSWSFFKDVFNVEVYDIDEISNMDFEGFLFMDNGVKTCNKINSMKFYCENHIKGVWEKIFVGGS